MAKGLELELSKISVRDNDVLYTQEFNESLWREGVQLYPISIQATLMNAYIEPWMKSLKVECLDHFIPVVAKHFDYLASE